MNPLHLWWNAPAGNRTCINWCFSYQHPFIGCHFIFFFTHQLDCRSSRYLKCLPYFVTRSLWSVTTWICLWWTNGLSFFSLSLEDNIFKMLNHFVALIWALTSLLDSFWELPVYYLQSHWCYMQRVILVHYSYMLCAILLLMYSKIVLVHLATANHCDLLLSGLG